MSLTLKKTSAEQDYLKNNKAINDLKSIARVFSKGGSFLFIGDNKKQIEDVLEFLTKQEACSQPKDSEPDVSYCGKCRDCQLIDARQHPDIHWIQPKGVSASIKIEDIRGLNERINLKPFQSERKIFIIQDAQRMGPEAANALLKTLEEPPQNASLVLISKSSAELLPTIVSRCKLLRFSHDGGNLTGDYDQINKLIPRFFEPDDISNRQCLYEDIAALDRSMVDQVLYELACVIRDIMLIGLQTDKVKFISAQPMEKIKQWSEYFNSIFLEQLMDQVIMTKGNISKNANIKLSIDLLIKSIDRYMYKNN